MRPPSTDVSDKNQEHEPEAIEKVFIKDNGVHLPVSDKYLHPFLSPTSKGTHFRQSPPPAALSDRQIGRVLLQIHQVLFLFKIFGVPLADRHLLDIGTGNGMVPRLLLELSPLGSAVGADPYLDGEHKTSWQPHDQDEAIQRVREFLRKYGSGSLDYDTYKQFVGFENFSLVPERIALSSQGAKRYRFAQVGAHDLKDIGERFDLFYCKAIEHIPNWDGVFRSISEASNDRAIIYLKHRSFFSFLGPHRYSTVNIPWGHLLLTDSEYKRFCEEFFPADAKEMIDFYFNGLTYPRMTVSDMVQIARDHGFVPITVIYEPTRYVAQVRPFIDDVPKFWNLVHQNFPQVPAEEVLSGMVHILLRKVT